MEPVLPLIDLAQLSPDINFFLTDPLGLLLLIIFGGGAMLHVMARRRKVVADFMDRVLAPATASSAPAELVPTVHRPQDSRWPIAGVLILAVAIGILEYRQPYFFTQDDILVGELPGMLETCRDAWAGHFPEYSSGGLGGPIASTGPCSATYPPLYVAYAVAHHVLGNDYATEEVYAALHLFFGLIATFALCRAVGIRPAVATAGALSFELSGSILIMGRSWHNFVCTALWLPLLWLCLVFFLRGRVGLKWASATAVVLGAYYHAAFPQVVILALLPCVGGVVVHLLIGRLPVRRLLWLMPVMLIGAGLCWPLFLQQWLLAGDIRSDVYGHSIAEGLKSMLLPYPVESPHPENWMRESSHFMGQFYYFGSVFAVLALACLTLVASGRWNRDMVARHIWALLLFGFLAFTLGPGTFYYYLLVQRVNVANLMHYPWRGLPEVVLLAVLSGGLLLEGFFRLGQLCHTRRKIWETVAAMTTVALLLYHVALPLPAFYVYGFKPYPPLPTGYDRYLFDARGRPTARVMPWCYWRSADPIYGTSLAHGLSSVAGVPTMRVEDPILLRSPIYAGLETQTRKYPAEVMRAYAVRWHVFNRAAPPPEAANQTDFWQVHCSEVMQALRLQPRLDGPDQTLAEAPDVRPMAYLLDDHTVAVELFSSPSGLSFTLPAQAKSHVLVVAYLAWPNFRYVARAAGGGETELDPLPDRFGRVRLQIPAGTAAVTITYEAHWFLGMQAGVALVGLGLCAGYLLRKTEHVAVSEPRP